MPTPVITERTILLVALGGILGALLRWYLASALTTAAFPWGTVVVNVVGSFAIGAFMFAVIQRGYFGEDARLFFVVGFLGAFTTMSSFAYESLGMMQDGEWLKAAGYFLLNPVTCILGAYVGSLLANVVPMAG
ncbi:MAG: fluoride efflux transporter CrcB [Thermoplasmatota archaeon]